MWERFSFYGLRPLLVLYMSAALADGGFGFERNQASAIVGIYAASVYLASLPGGWIADRLLGLRRAIMLGAVLISAGHISISFSSFANSKVPFFIGLVLIVLGTGLLKPNISAIVGELYPEGGARRDAGFSIFYMGINTGAILGPTITSLLGENYRWHWGFAAAGVGMILGLIQYKAGERHLGTAGLLRTGDSAETLAARSRGFFAGFAVVVALTGIFGWLVRSGTIPVTLPQIAGGLATGILVLAVGYFAYLWVFGNHTPDEKKRLIVIF